ncbi:coiled-coil protein [Candidatus Altiarchaeota archaeon]
MNDKDLKVKVEEFRGRITVITKQIADLMGDIRNHQKQAQKLRAMRDKFNDKCKSLSEDAKTNRNKRDELNQEIAGLKKERNELNVHVKKFTEEIKKSKVQRDEFNKNAKGTDKSLEKRYAKNLERLVNEDIQLNVEKKLFESLFTIIGRLDDAKKANELHQKVVATYNSLKEIDGKIDDISDKIRKLADESETFHKRVIELYSELDETRKKADDYHHELIEKYKVLDPLRDQIIELKKKIKGVEEEMSPFGIKMDMIKASKQAEIKEQKAMDAKEKLKSSKRISFDDLKALIETDNIELQENGKSAD